MVKEINMQQSIVQRISEAEAHLAALRARRGSALLDGENIDATEYQNAEAELAALRDAAGEAIRRDRAAAGQAREAHRDEQRDQLKDLARQRTEAIHGAEEGARQLIAGIEKAEAISAEMVSLAHQISGSVPSPLHSLDFARRVSNYVCAVLSGGRRGRIGSLALHHSMSKPADDWAETEARLLGPHLKSILEN